MPVYTCPECSAKVKRSQPVEAGKKLRCPECDTVFKVKGEKAAPAPAKKPVAAPTPARSKFDDDDGPANYSLSSVPEDSEESKAERDKAFGPLRERFAKGKRGPALQIVVKPSNFLILWGVIACICGVGTGLVATWDMIFIREDVAPKKTSIYDTGSTKTKYIELSEEERNTRLIWLAAGVGYFIWGAVVCLGASKMHEVESYWLAFTGAVMAMACPLLPLAVYLFMEAFAEPPDEMMRNFAIICVISGPIVAIWNISTLLNKKVKAGFAETNRDT